MPTQRRTLSEAGFNRNQFGDKELLYADNTPFSIVSAQTGIIAKNGPCIRFNLLLDTTGEKLNILLSSNPDRERLAEDVNMVGAIGPVKLHKGKSVNGREFWEFVSIDEPPAIPTNSSNKKKV